MTAGQQAGSKPSSVRSRTATDLAASYHTVWYLLDRGMCAHSVMNLLGSPRRLEEQALCRCPS